MNENNNNFLIAMALSFIVLMGWMYFIGQPQMKAETARQQQLAHQQAAKAAAQPVAPHASVRLRLTDAPVACGATGCAAAFAAC